MVGIHRVLIGSAVLLVAAAGCSNKKDDRQAGGPADPGAAPAGKKAPPKEDDIDGLIADFRAKMTTSELGATHDALGRMLKAVPPTHPRRADVYKVLREAYDRADPYTRLSVESAVPAYASPADLPELVALAEKAGPGRPGLYGGTAERLKDWKDPAAIPVAVRWWQGKPFDSLDPRAEDALRGFGPAAEPAVRPYIQPKYDGRSLDVDRRRGAIRLLGEIGTADSLPDLKVLLTDPAPVLREDAEKAIAAIEARLAKGKP